MKLKIKVFTAVIVSFCMLVCFTIPAFAYDQPDYFIAYDEFGNIMDQNMPIQPRSGTHTTTKVVDKGTATEEDCGFHPETTVWRKVSQYTFTTSSTISISVSANKYGGSVGISKTAGTSFSYSVKANQSKYSKIRVYLSYTWKRYYAKVYDNTSGQLINSYYFVTTQRTHENFKPYYQ